MVILYRTSKFSWAPPPNSRQYFWLYGKLGEAEEPYCARRSKSTVIQHFRWTKILPTPASAEIFSGINFGRCSKGCHILNIIINTGQKIRAIKISPTRADSKIGEKFLHIQY